MKRLYVIVGVILTLLSAFYFVQAIGKHWESLKSFEFGMLTLQAMIAAGVLYATTYLVSAATWQRALRFLGATLALGHSAAIILVSQFAKYLPGNVGHHVGRVLLAQRAGLPAQLVVGSLLVDSLMVVLAALLCSLPCYPLIWALASQRVALSGTWLLVILGCLLTAGAVAWLTRAHWLKAGALARLVSILANPKSFPLLGQGIGLYCISFLLGGLALSLLLGSLAPSVSPWSVLPEVVGVYAAAWLLGFLIPGAPAGLGIREACLLVGLAPIAGHDVALLAAALLRVTTTLMDAVVFAVGLVMMKRLPQA
ncbi:lysylphosphatidylglycerol synthase domain-containing protein [Pseudoxanthomonas indica]|uniref:Lysylphosphatidylglycerol synthase TM region n=1 Tax=Pseudoxanthomonas indica TaxID=428993 RepID=A0A1T5LEB5_9GAMM|nr:lysylphosphatidylglycerol synthase domain-containing protein [Pseudoxanthomonas indica]GGD34289.1 hypothetical protein GCM10007235_02660 [Pseudoxanthomonas indica]SKC74333.1 hypothetical protein SAMN06296058_2393 [Pseudoxanthomonas indica]